MLRHIRELSLCRIYREYNFDCFLNFCFSLNCFKNCINRKISFIRSFRIVGKSSYSEGLSVCIPTGQSSFSFYLPAYKFVSICCFYFRYEILLFGILINGVMNRGCSVISRELSLCRIYREYNFDCFLNFCFSLNCFKNCINGKISFIRSFRIVGKSGYSEGLSVCIPTARLFSFYLPSYKFVTVCCFYFRYKILLCRILIDSVMNRGCSIISREFSFCRIYREYDFNSLLNFRLGLNCFKNCVDGKISFVRSFRIIGKSSYSEGLSVCIPMTRLFSFYLPAYELVAICCFYFRYEILLFGILIDGVMNACRTIISREFSLCGIYSEYNF